MNFHLQEVSVHNLGICYGALGIALVPVVPVFIYFSHAEKNAFVAVERCWSNTLKMIKTFMVLLDSLRFVTLTEGTHATAP